MGRDLKGKGSEWEWGGYYGLLTCTSMRSICTVADMSVWRYRIIQ
jgi:hypothetical protein